VNHAGCWQGNERRRHPLPAQRKRAGAKKEQHGEASKKSQKKLQLKTQEEDQRRKSANFKPPSSADFQNAADIPAEAGASVLVLGRGNSKTAARRAGHALPL
jgi:hypothetical protein